MPGMRTLQNRTVPSHRHVATEDTQVVTPGPRLSRDQIRARCRARALGDLLDSKRGRIVAPGEPAEIRVALKRSVWLEPGDTFVAGDRRLRLVLPPIFDGPATRGLFDESTGVVRAVDSFASMTTGAIALRPWASHGQPGDNRGSSSDPR